MYQGAYVKKRRKSSVRMNRATVLLMAILMLIGVMAGSTVAYLVDKTSPVENTFEYATVSCRVDESFDGETKQDVRVTNTGTADAYIRATYVINWLDEHNNIVASVPEGYSYDLTCSSGSWAQGKDGFFYYLLPVAPGALTEGSLLTCTVTCTETPEYTLSVEVLAEAIQSTPASAVNEAWSAAVDGSGMLIVNR